MLKSNSCIKFIILLGIPNNEVKIMSSYKVSVLISSYNYADIIGETFESIRNQTFNFEDIEVIFVDDKSTDNSVEVIQEFVDKYDNVKLYITPEGKGGVSFSRNWSMELASADYITFIDSDDKFTPEFIESVYNEMVENDVDIVKTSFFFGFDGKISYSQNLGRVVVPCDNLTTLMTSYNYLEAWATLYNKQFLLDNNLRFSEKYKSHEAFLFSIQALTKTEKDIILLDNLEGYMWNAKQEGLHDKNVQFEEMNNTIECSSKMISALVEDNQPVECIETILPFILNICGSGLFNADATYEQKSKFFYEKIFHLDSESLSTGQKGRVNDE